MALNRSIDGRLKVKLTLKRADSGSQDGKGPPEMPRRIGTRSLCRVNPSG